MGRYLNPDNQAFSAVRNSDLFVDQSDLLSLMNRQLGSRSSFWCCSRPAHFGKTTTAQMFAAYYSRGADSETLFEKLAVNAESTDSSSASDVGALNRRYRNQLDVLYLDMAPLVADCQDLSQFHKTVLKAVSPELHETFPDVPVDNSEGIALQLSEISLKTGRRFFFIMDNYDALFLDSRADHEIRRRYYQFLFSLFYWPQHLIGCYLTGRLQPYKRGALWSTLDDFNAASMRYPSGFDFMPYAGLNETQVKNLCQTYGISAETMFHWFGGYHSRGKSQICRTASVLNAIKTRRFQPFFSADELTQLTKLIQQPIEGLPASVQALVNGKTVRVDPVIFDNDGQTFRLRDEVLNCLVHFGWLSFDCNDTCVCIPNEECRQGFLTVLKTL